MAKNVLITEEVVDDYDGKTLGPDEGRTVHWSIEGEHLEMDLSEANRQLFLADVEKWMRISRPDGKGRRKDEEAKTTGTVTRELGDVPPGPAPKRPAARGKSRAKPEGTSGTKPKRTREQVSGWRIGIRDWAKENGFDVQDKGAMPDEVKAAWDKAHPEVVAAREKAQREKAEAGSEEPNLWSVSDDSTKDQKGTAA
jgi:hypothetical protein